MKFLLNGDLVSRRALIEALGQERLNRMTEEAVEAHREDPLEEVSWFTEAGMVVVVF